MLNPKKDALLRGGKIPGCPKSGKKPKPSGSIPLEMGQIVNRLQAKELKILLGKGTHPAYLDFSPSYYQLEEDDVFATCPNIVKEMDLSSNALVECVHLGQLTKLKRLYLDNNLLCNIVFTGLIGVELLSLPQNRIEHLSDTSDLKKLVYLDLSGNRLSGGFEELGKMKSLRVLDLGNNSINLPIHEFYNYLLSHIKKLTKLEFLSFAGNPIYDRIKEFRCFIINEMPKLKYVDWEPVTKEDRNKSNKLESDGVWDDHLLPVKSDAKSTFSMRISESSLGYPTRNETLVGAPSQDSNAKARMFEMLLEGEKTSSSSERNRTMTVEDLMGGIDPLDDILNQLASNAVVTVKQSETKTMGDPPLPSMTDLPPMPAKHLTPAPVASERVDTDYLDLLNEMLYSTPLEARRAPQDDNSEDYVDILNEMISMRSDKNVKAPELDTKKKGITAVPKQELKSNNTPLQNANYLQLLQQMIAGESDDSTGLRQMETKLKVISRGDDTAAAESNDKKVEEKKQVDKGMTAGMEKLESLVKTFTTTTNSIKESTPTFEFSWESAANELYLSDKLGVGTFGEMWKGIWRSNEVTFKKITSHLAVRDYIRAQMKELTPLSHKNIVSIVGACLGDDVYVISDYVRGLNLFGLLYNKSLDIDTPFILKLAQGIASGMSYLHSKGVIHRSLKPKNILLDQEFNLIIRDYGFCQLKDSISSNQDVAFMAPELLKPNVEEYTEKVDVYSFGIVLWQLFTRMEPYKGLSQEQIIAAVYQNNLRPVVPLAPYVFSRLMEVCWSENPDLRPPFETIEKILAQPTEAILDYSPPITDVPRIPSSPRPSTSISSTSAPEVAYTSKMDAVLSKVYEMIASPSEFSQIRAANTLATLVQKEENIQPVVNFGLVSNLVTLLASSNDVVQEQSIIALHFVCETDAGFGAFKACKGLEHLITLLQSASNEALLLTATKLLTKIAKSAQNQIIIRNSGGLVALLHLLRSTNEFLQVQSVWALSLMLEQAQIREDFLNSGGLSPLLKLIVSSNPGLQIRVLTALGMLITNANAQDRILRAGLLPRFMDLLSSNSVLLQLVAVRSMSGFSSDKRILQELYSIDALPRLIQVLSSLDEQANFFALRVLVDFVGDEAQCNNFRTAQGIPHVMRILTHLSDPNKIQSLVLLHHLAQNAENRAAILAVDGLKKISQMLSSQNTDVQVAALSALDPFVFDDGLLADLSKSGAQESLLRLLSSSNINVQRESIRLLSELAREDSVKGAIMKNGVTTVVQLLSSNDDAIQESAVFAVSYLSEQAQYTQTLVNHGALRLTANLLKGKDTSIQERAIWTLANFAQLASLQSEIISTALPKVLEILPSTEDVVNSFAMKLILILVQNVVNKQQLAFIVPSLKKVSSSTIVSKKIQLAAQKSLDLLA